MPWSVRKFNTKFATDGFEVSDRSLLGYKVGDMYPYFSHVCILFCVFNLKGV